MPSPARSSARWGVGATGDSGAPGAEWEPRFRVPPALTLWLPVVLSFAVQVPAAVFAGRWRGFGSGFGGAVARELDDDPVRFWLRIGLAVLGPAALVFARRFPGPVVAVVSAAAGGYVLVVAGDAAPPYFALAFAVLGAVVRGARVWAWWSLGAAWVLTVVAGVLLGVSWQPALITAVTLALVLLLVLGEGIRSRRRRFAEVRARLAARRESTRQSAVQAERMRIARELHDVLAHSLSQISVQAGVGLHLIDTRPDEAATALANIKATSKTALDEVRSVLGILRADETDAATSPLLPEPGLAQLPRLLEAVRAQGIAVELTDTASTASPAPPAAAQLACYRIVQESLTNVARHSAARSAAVVLAATDRAWTVEVTDPGPAADPGAADPGAAEGDRGAAAGAVDSSGGDAGADAGGGPGRGLIGMRERALLLGGTLEAGPRADGGFAVRAVIPRAAVPGAAIPRAGGSGVDS